MIGVEPVLETDFLRVGDPGKRAGGAVVRAGAAPLGSDLSRAAICDPFPAATMIQEIEFAPDSPVEEDGFEPSVPLWPCSVRGGPTILLLP